MLKIRSIFCDKIFVKITWASKLFEIFIRGCKWVKYQYKVFLFKAIFNRLNLRLSQKSDSLDAFFNELCSKWICCPIILKNIGIWLTRVSMLTARALWFFLRSLRPACTIISILFKASRICVRCFLLKKCEFYNSLDIIRYKLLIFD